MYASVKCIVACVLCLIANSMAQDRCMSNRFFYSPSLLYVGRNTDSSDLYIQGLDTLTDIKISKNVFIRGVNQVNYGMGYYYISNPYSTSGRYNTTMFYYKGEGLLNRRFQQGRHAFDMGVGSGYRWFNFDSKYNASMNNGASYITNVALLYQEVTVPVFLGYQITLSQDLKMNFDMTLAYGHGLMKHRFTGSPTPPKLSWHSSYRGDFRFLTQYKSFTFGPVISYNYFTRGRWNGKYTVGPKDYLTFSSFGAMIGYSF